MSTETVNALETRQLVAGGLQAVRDGKNLLSKGARPDARLGTPWQGEDR